MQDPVGAGHEAVRAARQFGGWGQPVEVPVPVALVVRVAVAVEVGVTLVEVAVDVGKVLVEVAVEVGPMLAVPVLVAVFVPVPGALAPPHEQLAPLLPEQ
jgi:hypothetical protein